MTTIDLTATPLETPLDSAAAASGLLAGLPRRVALTLPELTLLAERAGGAPLPFQHAPAERPAGNPLAARLGGTGDDDRAAYDRALAALRDPVDSLTRRGLLVDGEVEAPLLGAVGLLATPEIGLDLDVTAAGIRVLAWHRQAHGAVAALATVDGIVFEIAWFASSAWADELARVPSLPEDVVIAPSAVPAEVDLPFELLDAAGEAVRAHRTDVLPVLAAQHAGRVRGADGETLSDPEAAGVVEALHTEGQGRIRAMLADVRAQTAGDTPATGSVGIVSWVLLADGWHALRPHREDGEQRVRVVAVEPADFPSAIAPVLAEVSA